MKKTKKKVYRNCVQFYKDVTGLPRKVNGKLLPLNPQCRRWRTFGANGEKTGASGQAHASKAGARENAKLVCEELASWIAYQRVTRDQIYMLNPALYMLECIADHLSSLGGGGSVHNFIESLRGKQKTIERILAKSEGKAK